MSQLTIGDRVVAGAVGAVIGALIGLALAWLFGVYSNTMGAGVASVTFSQWALATGAAFALVGLLFGPVVGTLLGMAIAAIFEFEYAQFPIWVFVALLVFACLGLWWWL